MKRAADTPIDDASKKAKVDPSEEEKIEFRYLIDNKQVGIIIGKGGTNVKRIRDETNVFCSILKLNPEMRNATDRVMTIKGHVEQVADGTRLIAQILMDAQNDRERKSSEASEEGKIAGTMTMKILIHKFLAGSIIGSKGAIIQDITQSTGARVQVSNDPLGASTEKTVTITGTPETLHAATLRVLTQLRDNPVKPGSPSTPYTPGQMNQPPPAPYGYPAPGMGGYGAPPPHHGGGYGAPPPAGGPYGAPPPHHYAPPPHHQQQQGPPPSMAASGPPPSIQVMGGATQKIAIPTVCAGSVIGKGGSIVRDLKQQSGCNVSIADPDPSAPTERVVTLSGTPQGIQHAIHMIRQIVEQYTPGAGAPQGY